MSTDPGASQHADAGPVPPPAAAPGRRSAHRLAGSVAALVGLDAVGGLLAIRDGINTPRGAWGSAARLAAPWPMVVAQVGLAALAVGPRRRVSIGASGLLSVACLVSAASGFFDGGLADDRLTRRHTAVQATLILWTALVAAVAADHGRRRAG